MMSQSLFNTMEFSLQPENYLDEMFGLSADVLAADLDTDGSILDLGLDGGLKHQQPHQESLEDLLLQSPTGDSFGEEWMETVDLKTLLDGNLPSQPPVPPPQPPVVEIKVEHEEQRKEGMKVAAFELLKALLTGNTSTPIELAPPTTPPVTSPVAEVPNLDFPDAVSDNVNFDMLIDGDEPQENPFEDLIEIQPLDNGDVAEIKPSDGPLIATIELLDTISNSNSTNSITIDSSYSTGFNIGSFNNEDVDSASIMSSEPSSPEFSTIDSSQYSDISAPSSVKSSQVSEYEFTKIKTKAKKEKVRSSPYDSDYDSIQDKKTRKKMQNKNAATRYRVKKRMEKETLQEQEVRLSDKNKELREKVESLQREIKYMKELMNEINKAKKRKI